MSDRLDIYEHDNSGPSILEIVIAGLLIIAFPIGILYLIIRTTLKVKRTLGEHRKEKAETRQINVETHTMIPDCLKEYHQLLQDGIISQNEYDRVRNKLLNKGIVSKLLRR